MRERKEPIRILQIIGKVAGGGVESCILNYYENIDHERFHFDFIMEGNPLPYFTETVGKYGGNIYVVTPYRENIFRYMKDIYRVIRLGHYDIIHSNMNTMAGFSLLSAKLAGAKIRILHNHATANKGEGIKTVLKYILRPAAKIFATQYCACSEQAAEWMYGKNWRKKCHIIYNAIDTNKFKYNPIIRKQLRKKLQVYPTQLVVGHVGRLEYAKNHEFLIDVFCELLQWTPNAILLLIGDGALRDQLQKKVNTLKIQKQVRFLGIQKNVNDWLQAMDLFLFPSWYEGLGLAAIEAQVAGLPVFMSEYVPREAKISPNSQFLNIEDGAEFWKQTIIKKWPVVKGRREIKQYGNYDIHQAVTNLESFYEKIIALR